MRRGKGKKGKGKQRKRERERKPCSQSHSEQTRRGESVGGVTFIIHNDHTVNL